MLYHNIQINASRQENLKDAGYECSACWGVTHSHCEVTPSGELFIGRADEGRAKVRSADSNEQVKRCLKISVKNSAMKRNKKTNRKGDIRRDSCNHFQHYFYPLVGRMRHSIIVSPFRLTRGVKDGY